MTRSEKILFGALSIGVIDTAWLSWRYVALKSGWVTSGTGFCSWTEFIDCDKVLCTPEARAFYVPNALLGFGFFAGCLLWWMLGRRYFDAQRGAVIRLLALWLGFATILTFWFFWLLAHLHAFCPFCPWNHFFTYVAFVAAVVLARGTPGEINGAALKVLRPLIALCTGQFIAILMAWWIFSNK